jgi:sirohydrochlorin cobaltochelatase
MARRNNRKEYRAISEAPSGICLFCGPVPASLRGRIVVSAGLILFAHGARDPRWADPLLQLKQRLEARAPALRVELAFLELMTPDLPRAAATLVAHGCTSICVVPIFLGQGGHVRRDLGALLQVLREAHPDIEVRSTPAVGEDAAVLDALTEYCLRTLEPAGRLPPDPRREVSHDP